MPDWSDWPDWKDEIRKRLAGLSLEPEREMEIVEGLARHVEDRCEELRAGGERDEAARRANRSDPLAVLRES